MTVGDIEKIVGDAFSSVVGFDPARESKPLNPKAKENAPSELVLLVQEGLTAAEMAERLGCTAVTAKRRLSAAGLKAVDGRKKNGGHRANPARSRAYQDCLARGLTLSEASKELGVTVSAVYHWARRHGVRFARKTPQQNTMWSSRVLQHLKDGYGAEDIAVIEGCDAEEVRREINVLRAEGVIPRIYRS